MENLKMHTVSIADKNFMKLTELFPNAITESIDQNGNVMRTVDAEVLAQEINAHVINGPEERYQFTWPGKRRAILAGNMPTDNTLRPHVAESMGRNGAPGKFDSENLYIEGDNLEVLKLLQETYLGKVKMIYIDPPYNTGNDFVYKDNFVQRTRNYLSESGQYDENGGQLVQNPESNGRFHSNWLNMMYSRLKIAKNLLADNGIIFISIDDSEQYNLRKICDEIFGENNFIGCAGRITKKSNNKGDFWAPNFDYVITYARSRDTAEPFIGEANVSAYNMQDETGPRAGEKYQLVRLYMSSIHNQNPEQRFWIECPDGSKILPPGKTFPPERPIWGDGIWRWSRKTFEENIDKIVIKPVRSSNLIDENGNPAKWNVFTKTYLNDVIDKSSAKPNNFIESHINQNASHELNALDIPFDYAKPSSLVKYLMSIAKVSDGDIVIDFFSGSATTAHAVMQLNAEDGGNRKYIMVQVDEQTPEKSEARKAGYSNICEIGKERIRRAGAKIKEETGADIDYGFRVLKCADSNMKPVYYAPSITKQEQLDVLADNIKEDRTGEDLLFQVMLELGVPLSSTIEYAEIAGQKVYDVGQNYLLACFDLNVTEASIIEIAKREPTYFVMRDRSMANDTVAANFEQIFRTYSPDTVRKVL